MSISSEDAIKWDDFGVDQNGGRAADPPLVPLLLSVARSVRTLHEIILRGTGIERGQDELLIVLKGRRLAVRDLAIELGIRPSTVSKMIDRMAVNGYVVRSSNQFDERLVMVGLTEKGRDATLRVEAAHQAFEAELRKALGREAERDVLKLLSVDYVLEKRLRRHR
ncbi:MarR family winged helix-turn-helix transcriptional regulator [Aureimonas leprariae]|uniref:Winged helix-turn-helix transcriptional regulator n=1 Tax=Plantimonas leprariae TaxID=2615207 RepID=A0A7V7PQ17_9HYPH|nr:MarR family winged helix-turn-helix transcriptional regulator [Aureimonas leprariae]KAB0680184.1 winged helix-turn-helix transcriptional regulator [Aureimonas leprariae]